MNKNFEETNPIPTITIEDLKGLSVAEQIKLLQDSGYQRGAANSLIKTSLPEWRLITDADDGGYVEDESVDLLSVERHTVPFVLMDEQGAVIDEYNHVRLFYWDTDPARLIAECWIKGGEPVEVLTMPASKDKTSNGFYVGPDSGNGYILTAYDYKCFEEEIRFHWSGRTKVLELANGRFALGDHVWGDGKSWNGFPVCKDGDKKLYKDAIVRQRSSGGVGNGLTWELGKHDSMTFPTREAALAWAERSGVEVETETD